MDNLNGALGFQATLDIDDFNVSAQAMERRIQQVSATAQSESAEMEGMFGKAAQAFAGIVGIGAAKSFVSQMISVRSEMQNTEASFKVFLGTANKANEFFSDLQRYAYNNVFEFADLSKQAAQLLAFRNDVNDVIPIIDKLSNIAAGANAPLAEFVSLYNKAKANNKLLTQDIQMWESRGVPVVYELAQAYGKSEQEIRSMVTAGKVGFKELDTVVTNLTSKGGMFAGMMVEKMKTLGDSIGLLQDNITNMFNELGASNQGVLKSGIDLANAAVENYQQLGRVLGSLVVAYGTYKAAMVATSLAQKSGTGIAVLDNTIRSIKLKILQSEALLSGQAATATETMTVAETQHLAALQAELTAEERAAVLKQMRVAAIASLLTAQQQEYLSNINLTTSSTGYEAAAMSVLTAEQRLSLEKMDLTAGSQAYKVAVEQEVAAKQRNIAAMRTEVSAAYARREEYKATAIAAQAAVEQAKYEVYWAKQSGDATRIAAAEKKLEGAEDNASVARKAALGAQTDFLTKKKQLEAATTRQNVTANTQEATSEIVDAAAKDKNSQSTSRLTVALKALWTTIKANPLGWVISIAGTVLSLLMLFRKRTDENTDAATEFTNKVREETSALSMYFQVLSHTEKGTNAHKDALQKINTVCKQYNETLLDENATLDEQTKKYEKLTAAIRKTSKEKVLSSNIELIQREATEDEEDALKGLKKSAKKARSSQSVTAQSSAGATTSTQYTDLENIQSANAGVWESVEQLALDAVSKLKNKEGKAYEETMSGIMDNILDAVQRATGATDDEMSAFAGTLEGYVQRVVGAELDAQKQIEDLTGSIDRFYGTVEDSPAETKIDYASKSLQELDDLAKQTQAEIEKLSEMSASPGADTTELDKLKATALEIQTALTGKVNALNTENDINTRIKQLKDERGAVEIGSAKYRELSNEITKLQNKLPKTYESIEQKRKAFNEKMLSAQRELEEAQLELIDDGVEKQEKALELQHQRNLDRIKKEREEAQKSKKAAGQGELSKSEEQVFTDQENAENRAYSKQQMKLVDEEIAYKKGQYELYWKWVAHIGKDAADKQFATLLAGGSSFQDYVNKEMAKLTSADTSSSGTGAPRSEADNNRLLAFSTQQAEISGAKSAMDLYTESLSNALEQASSLAERIEVIADYKERLSEGEFNLNEDETAVAMVGLNEQEAQNQKDVTNTLLSEFQTYEEQRLDITKHYKALREAAEAEGNADRLALVNKGEQEALSALNASMLMQTESWQNLFSDLDGLTIDQIDKLVSEIREKMNTADLNMNPADMKAVLDRLDEAKQKILNVNPFKGLGKAINGVFSDMKKGAKSSSEETKRNWQDLADASDGCFDFINDAIDNCEVLSDLIGDSGQATLDMIQGMTAAGIAMAAAISTAEKSSVILTAISVALQAIQWIASLFDDSAELEANIAEHDKAITELERDLERLQDAYDKTYWEYSDEEREAHNERLQAIEDEISALEKRKAEIEALGVVQRGLSKEQLAEYTEITAKIEELNEALKEAQRTGDMFSILDAEKKNLEAQIEEVQGKIDKVKDSKSGYDQDEIDDYEEEIKNLKEQINDINDDLIETLAGTDIKSAIDEFGDAIWDACIAGEDAVEALGDTIKDTLRNAVKEALKRKYLAKGVEDAITYLASAMEDGVLDDNEKAKVESMLDAAGEEYKTSIEALGDWLKDADEETEDAMTGAARNITEETGSLLAGRMNAVIINQSVALQLTRDQLAYQAQIAANTAASVARLETIENTLKRIENAGTSLLSQGIS